MTPGVLSLSTLKDEHKNMRKQLGENPLWAGEKKMAQRAKLILVTKWRVERWPGEHGKSSRGGMEAISWYSMMEHSQLGHGGIFGRLSPGGTDRLFGPVSTSVAAIIGMVGFLHPGERMRPTELGRDRNQEDHKRWEGNSWGRESLEGS